MKKCQKNVNKMSDDYYDPELLEIYFKYLRLVFGAHQQYGHYEVISKEEYDIKLLE